MTPPVEPTTGDNLPVLQLKAILQTSNDEALAGFLHSHALGFIANQLIGAMTEPQQRIQFFIAIAQTYPDDWKQAVIKLTFAK
jgi:ATP-dependent exoDNAse (exonuclease V) beta subunit